MDKSEKRDTLQKEIKFELCKGIEGSDGNCFKNASMRLATGSDEISIETDMSFQRIKHIKPIRDFYLLSKVLTKLGPYENSSDKTEITVDKILSLPVGDIKILSEKYQDFNFGIIRNGTNLSTPSEEFYREAAIIAYYFHWSFSEIKELSPIMRKKWILEIEKLNESKQSKKK